MEGDVDEGKNSAQVRKESWGQGGAFQVAGRGQSGAKKNVTCLANALLGVWLVGNAKPSVSSLNGDFRR